MYVLSEYEKEKVKELITLGIKNGYGADVSTGKGIIDIESIEDFSLSSSGNRVMALANFVPKEGEIKELRGDLITKYGKLGGDFVFKMNPFKKPIAMYKEGSTFELNGENRGYVGCLLSNVHSDSRIKHYAFAPIIHFTEEE
ncbi:MAG: hypothetical protein ACP5QT_03025 [Brevinematia bacterium]